MSRSICRTAAVAAVLSLAALTAGSTASAAEPTGPDPAAAGAAWYQDAAGAWSQDPWFGYSEGLTESTFSITVPDGTVLSDRDAQGYALLLASSPTAAAFVPAGS